MGSSQGPGARHLVNASALDIVLAMLNFAGVASTRDFTAVNQYDARRWLVYAWGFRRHRGKDWRMSHNL